MPLWDVDGRRYVDFMCSWGPNILGHKHPAVTEAVQRQMAAGDCLNGPTERMVELAERLVRLIPHADWALFSKNGTDATTTCVTLARAATGRRKILAARGAYHGAVPWCTPHPLGVTAEDRAHLIEYVYNDIASLEAAVEAGGRRSRGRHRLGVPPRLWLRPGIAERRIRPARARAVRRETGAALILDDVRAGFRLTLRGSWDLVGVQPDLSAWSKAIANGYALSAVTGNDQFARRGVSLVRHRLLLVRRGLDGGGGRDARRTRADRRAARHAGNGPALPRRDRRPGRRGWRRRPSERAAANADDSCSTTTPISPRASGSAAEALKRGVYLHPRHNMFLSTAHTAADIDFALGGDPGAHSPRWLRDRRWHACLASDIQYTFDERRWSSLRLSDKDRASRREFAWST